MMRNTKLAACALLLSGLRPVFGGQVTSVAPVETVSPVSVSIAAPIWTATVADKLQDAFPKLGDAEGAAIELRHINTYTGKPVEAIAAVHGIALVPQRSRIAYTDLDPLSGSIIPYTGTSADMKSPGMPGTVRALQATLDQALKKGKIGESQWTQTSKVLDDIYYGTSFAASSIVTRWGADYQPITLPLSGTFQKCTVL